MQQASRRFRSLNGQSSSASSRNNIRHELRLSRGIFSKVRLTPREIEVLTLVAQGNAYAHIAHRLSISEDTAKVHIEKVRRKLNAKNKTHAAVIAVTKGLIEF